MDSDKKRHILKTLTWRIIATGITFLVALLITGEVHLAMGIGAIEFLLKSLAYYGHERFWFKYIRFAKKEAK